MKNLHSDTSIRFYEVSKEYIDYLRQFENKIPNIEYKKREKFVAGILFKINDMNYLAPISSFNKQQKTNYVLKFDDYPVGSIRFSFMMPVPSSELHLKDFTADSKDYQRLVKSELSVCKKNSSLIRDEAYKVYNKRVSGKNHIYNENCCDFKNLESKCQEWIQSKSKAIEASMNIKFAANENNCLTLQERIEKAMNTKKSQNSNNLIHKKTLNTKERKN